MSTSDSHNGCGKSAAIEAAQSPDACMGIDAAEAIERAKAELKKAQEFYEEVRRRAADQFDAVRQKTVGDLLDTSLGFVKKHPGAGLAAAAMAGFVLGRIFRK